MPGVLPQVAGKDEAPVDHEIGSVDTCVCSVEPFNLTYQDRLKAETPHEAITFCVVSNSTKQVERLRESLYHSLGGNEPRMSVVDGNEYDIFSGYNRAANPETFEIRSPYLAFVHHDVEILTSTKGWYGVIDMLRKPSTGILGVAGSQAMTDSGIWWMHQGRLTGACMHGSEETGAEWMTSFGPYARAIVLDGVFLAMSRKTFERLGGFDEKRYTGFDFYDIDITLRSHLAGLKNYTVPVMPKHYSPGDVSNRPGWHENREKFLKYWRSKLPVQL